MKRACIFLLLFAGTLARAQQPSGDEILKKVDENSYSATRIVVYKMVIHGRRSSRTLRAKSWIEGEKKSFTEYLAPAREQGTKMLKLEDDLWMYSPSTDRTIRISGHMLRQSVMGSDLSYEDMMEDHVLTEMYQAALTGQEELNGRPCWVILCTAKTADPAYHSRKIWVDRERYIGLREERYAKSGRLLKTTDVDQIRHQGERWVAGRVVFKDALKEGEGTEFILEEVSFNQPIPAYLLSKAALRR